jgi:large subunit ribosomal protein L35
MKLKTHKAILKRIKITKGNKIKIRTSGQDHFNSRESGKTRRNKKRDHTLSKSNARSVHKLLPYS